MPPDRALTLRGGLAGAVAAAVWAAQSRLDCHVFGVAYRDQELLGKAVTRGRAAVPLGWGLHIANGAAFGALYANVAHRLPLPAWVRGPAAGLVEHLATWPLVGLSDRLHPARNELPRLSGSVRAFAQSTWRHLLFGAVLGELERRLNQSVPAQARPSVPAAASNGHGDLSYALGTTPR